MTSRRLALTLATVLACAAAAAAGGGVSAPGDPLDGLTAEERQRFEDGKGAFEEPETPERGLGPFFNGVSCAECHGNPATGGVAPPTRPELRELRIGRLGARGEFDPLLALGGPVLHRQGLGDLPEAVLGRLPLACREVRGTTTPPREAQFASFRIATPLFGGGLLEAIPVEEILRRADPQDADHDGISGRPNVQGTDVGRFGWKAQQATLLGFAGEAYLIEMGFTNPLAPHEAHAMRRGAAGAAARACDTVPELENAGEDVVAFADFMRFLAPPGRGPITAGALRGEHLFRRAGCDGCHVPELRTGPNQVAALDRKPVRLFSDLLVHDIGTGDGIPQGGASGNEFRTAPLWGLRFRPFLLHDGSAGNVLDAIRAHRGEAARSSAVVFRGFTARERLALVAFLESL